MRKFAALSSVVTIALASTGWVIWRETTHRVRASEFSLEQPLRVVQSSHGELASADEIQESSTNERKSTDPVDLVGCADVTNPVADGIPIRVLPPELIAPIRDETKPISLTLLRQLPRKIYKVDAGDVLGVYVEGIVGDRSVILPVKYNEVSRLLPAGGVPVPVQEDGTISLPQLKRFSVKNMTLDEIRDLIFKKMTEEKKLIQPEARISTTLFQKRSSHVSVIPEEPERISSENRGVILCGRNGGYAVDLPEGENDVLGAIIRSEGATGFDAIDEVVILRNGEGTQEPIMIHIPMRLRPNQPVPFKPEDIILNDGDVCYIKYRPREGYYIVDRQLPPSEHVLPRGYDLDVLEAVRPHRPLYNGGLYSNNQFSAQFLLSGLGFSSPNLVNILRKASSGAAVQHLCGFEQSSY